MDKQLIERLRTQADEIASASHAGWGNTMRDAADELERIDAERGKDAIGYVEKNMIELIKEFGFAHMEVSNINRSIGRVPIFFSPTIPEGMAQDAERYRFIRMNRLWLKANLTLIAAPAFDEAIDAGLLAAAQGERNAD